MQLTDTEQAVIDEGAKWINDNADQLFGELEALVARPALSGAEGTHSDRTTPVGRLYEFLEEHAGPAVNLDMQQITDDYVETPRENVYATLPGQADGGGLICTSHTDIVPAGDHEDWPGNDPFTLSKGQATYRGGRDIELLVEDETYNRQIRDKMARTWKKRDEKTVDVLVGRGAFDNKASIICMVGSMLGLETALQNRRTGLAGTLVHGHLVDEEVYQIGVKHMVGWNDGADWFGSRYDPEEFSAVVLEGSYGFVPVVGHRGLVWVVLEASGESAHASTPELGRNAVVGLSKALGAADEPATKNQLREPFVTDDYLGAMTVAPGTTVVGGDVESVDGETKAVERSGLNSIPNWAEATFDLRIPRWEGFPDGVTSITDVVCEHVESVASAAAPEVEFTARVPDENYFPPVALADSELAARSHPLVEIGKRATESTFGYTPHVDIAPGVTDAAFLYHGTRVPTLVEYGPAGGLSHEPLEYVEREQVIEGAKTMLEFAVREVGLTDAGPQE
jgi:acetylornithine deacetylase